MDIAADVLIFRHRMQHFICNIFGMRSGKAHAEQGRDQRNSLQQFAEGYGFFGCFVNVIITVYVLSEKRYFPVSIFKKLTAFINNAYCITAALTSSGERHTQNEHILLQPRMILTKAEMPLLSSLTGDISA